MEADTGLHPMVETVHLGIVQSRVYPIDMICSRGGTCRQNEAQKADLACKLLKTNQKEGGTVSS